MSHVLVHEPELNRYSLFLNDRLASAAEYVIDGGSILFTHTFTDFTHRGQGLAAEVIGFAMNEVESTTSLRVVPMCSYVVEWFALHPERAALLTRTAA